MNGQDQLVLEFPVRTAQGRADFLVTDANADALAWLDRWPDWPGPALCLYGPRGSGKSHLLQLWCEGAGARQVVADQLSNADVAGLADERAIAIDDVDDRTDLTAIAQPLLHLYNLLRENDGSLLLAARQPPKYWPLELPDLRSRLLAAPAVGIQTPDDELFLAVMAKMFADRQVRVGRDVLSYLATRIERSFEAAELAVHCLDHASLSGRRPITVRLAREAIAADDRLSG